jgi:hypothetical protein
MPNETKPRRRNADPDLPGQSTPSARKRAYKLLLTKHKKKKNKEKPGEDRVRERES